MNVKLGGSMRYADLGPRDPGPHGTLGGVDIALARPMPKRAISGLGSGPGASPVRSDVRATTLVGSSGTNEDPLLPLGLDSHRYRCCGNGVVANVAEWVGVRLAQALEGRPGLPSDVAR